MYKGKIISLVVMVTHFLAASAFFSCASFNGNGGEVKKVIGSLNGEPVIPRRANRISIPDFLDRSGDPSIARKTTLRVRDLISSDGRLSVVAGEADLVLLGKILSQEIQPIEFGTMHQPTKKRLRIIAAVKLINSAAGRPVFNDSPVQAFETFSEIIPPVSSEHQTRERVIENLALRITHQTLSGWYTDLMTPTEKAR